MSKDIFISYSHQDNDYAHELANEIETQGFTVWIDDLINYGDRWSREIEIHLNACKVFILIMSPESFDSDWVHNELSYAQDLDKRIFPLLLKGKTSWLSVKSLQYIDVTDYSFPNNKFYDHLSKLIARNKAAIDIQTKEKTPVNLLYSSNTDKIPFEGWSRYASSGNIPESIRTYNDKDTNILELKSFKHEDIGVEKSLNILHGIVEFEYKVVFSNSEGPNIYYCMIPMQQTGIDRTGLIEVGSNNQDDIKNQHSLYRIKYVVPMKSYNSDMWLKGILEFDFRNTPTAFYSIFAPRINEGCPDKSSAKLLTKNINVFQ